MSENIHVKTISELHDYLDLPRPDHPLITVFPHRSLQGKIKGRVKFNFDLYQISLKEGIACAMGYGRTSYDFDDGSMTFLSPGQPVLVENVEISQDSIGWSVAFHPDLIRKSELGRKIDQFTFFNYEISEALHLSRKEIVSITDITEKIKNECSQNMDRHSQTLIISNLELLLNYCVRFYDRQFYTRSNVNQDHISRFESLLKEYYQSSDNPIENGIPKVKYLGRELGLSPYYLSDLLKRETGKNALEHIHLFLIDKAKNLLLEKEYTITQVSYDLGFEYPQHFSKLFKSKTGMTPREFRTTEQVRH